MVCNISKIAQSGACQPPRWMADNIMFECKNGSYAYGVNNKDSDIDYLAYCVPPKDLVFYTNEIPGFGTQKKRFEQYSQQVTYNGEQYDLTCYSIVKYFQLCMECNPNMIETLFYPQDCITFSTELAQRVRDSRKLFLHKGAYQRFKGYSYAQLHKATAVQNDENIKKIRDFESDKNINHNTTLLDLENEIKKRNLI